MKKIITLVFIFFSLASHAQNNTEIIAVKVGYSSTNVIIKEANSPDLNLFVFSFFSGNTFVGEGLEVGISKSINPNVFIELGYSNFKGGDLRYKINSYERSYTLNGFQVPISINYLFRKEEKKLRFNLGAGLQYFESTLNEFESYNNTSNVPEENQFPTINISEVHFLIRPGVQYRLLRNLTAAFVVKVSLSPKGRYTDNPAISVKYALTRKG
ncbi:outer membrane beta-barrel protein [Pedobacter sp. GSP4]|uniref:outer membrane beta-barrel protein n=1 Tax=Pedobacter sp. GSP4 TaxID=3453716 RepID=UPI003EEB2FE1